MSDPHKIVLNNIALLEAERGRNGQISKTLDSNQKPILKNMTAEQSRTPKWMDDIVQGKTKIDNGDGSISTIKSITFESDGKTYLAPSIRVINGKPVELSPDKAVQYAKEKKDALEFKSQKEADTFDKNFHEQEYNRLGVGPSPKNVWK